jgi:hypothetical protein
MQFSRRQWLSATSAITAAGSSTLLLPSSILAQENDTKFEEITDKSRRAIDRGVEWLMKTLHREGGCGVDIGQPSDIGCTAMVGLSLMSLGNTPIEGEHSRTLRRIVAFMLRKVETMPNDDITSATSTQLQNKIGRHAHSFFAALFLSQILGEGWDPKPVRAALDKLVKVIVKMQTNDGNWAGNSWAPVLGTVTGWLSLRGADFVGIKVGSSPHKTAEHLEKQMKQQIGSGGWMHTLYKNATGIRVLYELGLDNDEIAKKAFGDVLQLVKKDNTAFAQAGGEEYLAFHLITETMLQKGGKDWATWFPAVRDRIISVQNRDGSWTGHHCITSRTFCTAAAILVLSSPNRYLPISQP